MQRGILDQVTSQSEALTKKAQQIEGRSRPFDSVDLTSLSAVKEFLHQEQVCLVTIITTIFAWIYF